MDQNLRSNEDFWPGVIFIIGCLFFLSLGIGAIKLSVGMRAYAHELDQPLIVDGILTEASVEPHAKSGFEPRVAFTYEVGGIAYRSSRLSDGGRDWAATPEEVEVLLSPYVDPRMRFKEKVYVGFRTSERWKYLSVNAPVKVYCSPTDPAHAVLKLVPHESNHGVPLVFGIIMIAFSSLGLIIVAVGSISERAEKKSNEIRGRESQREEIREVTGRSIEQTSVVLYSPLRGEFISILSDAIEKGEALRAFFVEPSPYFSLMESLKRRRTQIVENQPVQLGVRYGWHRYLEFDDETLERNPPLGAFIDAVYRVTSFEGDLPGKLYGFKGK